MARKYWWVNQTLGFQSELANARLWTAPNPRGELHFGRRLILDLRPGDVVFHYSKQAVRALSTVESPAARMKRPSVYRSGLAGEPEDGWAVRLRIQASPLLVPGGTVATLLTRRTSTLDKNGQPNRRYLSELSSRDANALLHAAGVSAPEEETIGGLPISEILGSGDPSDGMRWAKFRTEQRLLRAALLGGRATAECSLCGHVLPARLLVAAHIKPRRDCSEKERQDHGNVAMLLCVLGCDALFEWGYVKVDSKGFVRRGVRTTNAQLKERIAYLLGRRCSKHTSSTAAYFAFREASFVNTALL